MGVRKTLLHQLFKWGGHACLQKSVSIWNSPSIKIYVNFVLMQ